MDSKTIKELIFELRSQDPHQQNHALIEIKTKKQTEVISDVLPLLQSKDEFIRGHAAETLGMIGGNQLKQVGDHLIILLSDSNHLVRNLAAEALGNLPYPQAINALSHCLQTDSDELVRICAAESLGFLEDPKAIPILLSVLETEEASLVRAFSIQSLGLLGSSNLINTLLHFSDQENERVQIDLLQACIRLGDEASISRFASLMQSVDEDLLLVGANALSFLLDYKPSTFIQSQQTRLKNLLADVQQQYTRLAKERNLWGSG